MKSHPMLNDNNKNYNNKQQIFTHIFYAYLKYKMKWKKNKTQNITQL